jgi:hypothetical protein
MRVFNLGEELSRLLTGQSSASDDTLGLDRLRPKLAHVVNISRHFGKRRSDFLSGGEFPASHVG